eukprot:3898133-Ditylum_brightwellii.AAC.1
MESTTRPFHILPAAATCCVAPSMWSATTRYANTFAGAPSRMKAAWLCPTGNNTRLKKHHLSTFARDAL